MSTGYRIHCDYAARVDPVTVHKVCYTLVACWTTYNTGSYAGWYQFIPDDGEIRDHRADRDDGPAVERIPEIVAEYRQYDPETTTLSLGLAEARGDPVEYEFSVVPKEDYTRFTFTSTTGDAGTPERFLRVVRLARTLCERFDVRYASFRTEFENTVRPADTGLTEQTVTNVTYLGSDLVERVGRERVRSTPAYEVSEDDSGGVFLVVEPSPDPDDYHERVQHARDHLL